MADVAGALTALAGLIGALIAAYRILRPSPEPEPEPRPEDDHRYDHVSDAHDPGDVVVISELRAALAEARNTVHALRRRLDAATGIDTADSPPKQDWLGGS